MNTYMYINMLILKLEDSKSQLYVHRGIANAPYVYHDYM